MRIMPPDRRLDALSTRQREVLELLAKGLTNEDIGSVLGIGAATVKTHVSAILKTLEVDNRTEAAGLVNLADDALDDEFGARPAVAVLRFQADGWPTEEGELFARGLVDDLISLLCQWRWFPVIARTSSLSVDATGDVAAIGRALAARYILRGTVRRSGDRLRLTTFLEDAERGACIWSERFDVAVGGLFEAQDELARQIVGVVYPSLISAEIWRARRSKARTLSAWTLTHQGIWRVERRSPEDNLRAHELLDRALAVDDTFLPAVYAKGLAEFYSGLNLWSPDIARNLRELQRYAEVAVGSFPEAPYGHMLRARTAMVIGDMSGAIAHVEVATAIIPSLAEGHALLGQLLATSGRQSEGLARMRRAHRLNPRASVAGIAIALFADGRWQEALDVVEPVLLERPHYLFARMIAAGCRVLLGDLDGARMHAEELRRDHPDFRTSSLRQAYETRGLEVADRLFEALHRVGLPR